MQEGGKLLTYGQQFISTHSSLEQGECEGERGRKGIGTESLVKKRNGKIETKKASEKKMHSTKRRD